MSCRILTAPAAGGKTEYAVQLARQRAAGLANEVRVCVPTALQVAAFRRRLAAAGGAMGVQIYTYDGLVGACLTAAGRLYSEIPSSVQYQLLRSIVADLSLDHYVKIAQKPGFISILQVLFEDLKNAQVFTDQFSAAIRDMGDEPRLHELATIYEAYQDRLHEEGWADRVGKSWLAGEALSETQTDACRNWPLLIIDGFDDFEPVQLALLKALASRVGELVVLLPAAASGAYQRYAKTQIEVEDALDQRAQPLEPQWSRPDGNCGALDHLGRTLFVRPSPSLVSTRAITLREVPQPDDEVRESLRWLKQQIIANDWNPADTALLARNLNAFRPFIQQVAAEFGVPVQLVDRVRLTENPLINAMMEYLRVWLPVGDADEPSLLRRDVVNALRSPYFEWKALDQEFTIQDADRLDTLARGRRVIGGRAQWDAAFRVPTSGAECGARLVEDEDEAGGTRTISQTTFTRIATLWNSFAEQCGPPTDAESIADYVRWLENLIGDEKEADDLAAVEPRFSLHIARRAKREQSEERVGVDQAALTSLKEVLRGLVWAEQAVGRKGKVTYRSFVQELFGAIQEAGYEVPPDMQMPGIVVTSAVNARGVSYKAVALMGLNEGVFPSPVKEDTVLREKDRDGLRMRGLPLDSSIQSAEREFFYDAVTRSRCALLITRSTQDENGVELESSIFWNEVKTRFSDLAEQTIGPRYPASEAELMLALARDGREDHAWKTDTAWMNVMAGAKLAAARARPGAMSGEGDLGRLTAQLAEMYPPDHQWSPSRLEAYQTCGYYYFAKHVIELLPQEEPEVGLGVAQLGTLYHQIFQAVYERGVPPGADEKTIEAHVRRHSQSILNNAPDTLCFQPAAWWNATQREIVERVTESVVKLEASNYVFEEAERNFGQAYDERKSTPPLTVTLEDGRVLHFKGIIDRIDRHETDGTLRIIDYKLGSKSGFGEKKDSKVLKLQLQIYAKAAEEVLGKGPVSRAFYWHFKKAEEGQIVLGQDVASKELVDKAVKTAADAVDQIRWGQFAPIPPDGGCPGYCPAAAFCAHYTPKQGNW